LNKKRLHASNQARFMVMKIKSQIIIPVLLLATLAFGNGCALVLIGGAAAAGAGAVYYIDGELKDTEPRALDAVHAASAAALRDLQFVIISDTQDAISAKLLARTATDRKIQITLTKQSPAATEIRIRVGTFGDESLSRQILEKIKNHL
jgi:hypothetical protein